METEPTYNIKIKKMATGEKKHRVTKKNIEPIKNPTTIQSEESLNEKFVGLLDQLTSLLQKKGEPFKAKAYQKAQETIMILSENLTPSNWQTILKGKPGIGSTILQKLQEFVNTGTLGLLERERNNPVNLFSDIYGVGPKKAKDIVEKGITTIEDLRKNQDSVLNAIQKVGLKYYEDIMKRIPRSEIEEYESIFKKTFDEIVSHSDPSDKNAFEIVGSFRRGALHSGDIDIIITGKTCTVFKEFIDKLIADKIIVEVLSRGPSKCLVIGILPGEKNAARRIDFLYTSPEEYPFSILYFTGSKIFNTIMRSRALTMGYSLNEHGLYHMISTKNKGEKISHTFLNEASIFEFLKMQYKKPEERIDGRAVVPLDSNVSSFPIENISVLLKEEPSESLEYPIKIKIPKEKKEKTQKVPKEPKPKKEKTQKVPKEPKPKKEKTQKVPKEPKPKKEKTQKAPKEKKESKPKKIKILADEIPALEETKTPEKNDVKTNGATKKMKEVKEPKRRTKKNPCPPCPPCPGDIQNTVVSNEEIVNVLQRFKHTGISILENVNEDTLNNMLIYANNNYYNLEPGHSTLLTDNEYDILKEFIERKYPKNKVVKEIGAPIEKNKVTLPFQMPSMDKIKPDTGTLSVWTKKYSGPYVLSCKLDGVSGLYVAETGKTPKLYTRGNGTIGQDVSHLIPYLKFPGEVTDTVVRGEFIMSKSVFSSKYQTKFANARNLVAGIVNRQTTDDKMNDIEFVAYEVIRPELKPTEQMEFLKTSGFTPVLSKTVSVLSNEALSTQLVDWRTNYSYEIDGVIVSNDAIYKRVSGNPDHAFAFKMVLSDQMAEAKVVDVIWNASKDGYLKPRVQIEPLRLGGVTIEYATGFNASFIETNKIGVGTIIKIIRSGDVIPYIKEVVVPAERAKMPDVDYHWNDTHIDIILDNHDTDQTVKEKNITGFFKGIEVENLSGGNVARIVSAGFDTIAKIIHMSKADFLTIDGFKEKTADKLYTGIRDKLSKAALDKLMSASNVFGRGFSDKKIELIIAEYPDILTSAESALDKKARLTAVKGMAKKTADAFVENIPPFLSFLQECGLSDKLVGFTAVTTPIDTNHPLYNKSIVMSGTRDKDLEKNLKTVGAKVGSSVSKNTFAVVTDDIESDTGKVKDAKDAGVLVITPSEFRKKYF